MELEKNTLQNSYFGRPFHKWKEKDQKYDFKFFLPFNVLELFLLFWLLSNIFYN